MAPFPIPEDEIARLRTLRDYELLDTDADPEFDDIVHLAAIICEVPISLVTMVDADHQVFKARVGLRSTGTTRSISFCAHAIAQRDLFIVKDARMDDRFHDNPDVLNFPHICFYAGLPILSPEDVALGTLCVIDHKPRELDARQRESLRILGRLAQAHIKRIIAAVDAIRPRVH